MKKSITITFITVLLFQISLLAQVSIQGNLVELKGAELEKLHEIFRDFKTFRLDTRTLSNFFQGKSSDINFKLRIGSHYQWTINLEANELRAAYYRVSVNDEIVESLDNDCLTYKGF